MLPEETVQAHLDVNGQVLLPVHWGAFTLAFHAWTDPIERITAAAATRGVSICTPRIVEPVELSLGLAPPNQSWWLKN